METKIKIEVILFPFGFFLEIKRGLNFDVCCHAIQFSPAVEIRIYESIIFPVVLHGYET
jgi:hypothetical protein